MLRKIQ